MTYPDSEQYDENALETCRLRRARSEQLEPELIKLAGEINAADYRFLKLLAEFDNNGWWGDGIKSFAHWLNFKIGLNDVVAREKVRVARALTDLPLIDEAFRLGKLSYSKVRAMTRVATPNNEDYLLMIAEYGTASHIEQLTRKFRYCQRLDAAVDDDERWKKERAFYYHVEDDGMFVFEGRFPAEEGAVIVKALEMMREAIRRERGDTPEQIQARMKAEQTQQSEDQNQEQENENDSQNVSAGTFVTEIDPPDILDDQASAMTQLAEQYLESASGPQHSLSEKYQVLLHINANEAHIDHKINQGDTCYVENGKFLSREVARQLACDTQMRVVLEDDDGKVLDIGRKSRTIPRAIAHALNIRDGGCCYPGCGQSRWTDAHHVEHRAAGGETKLDNLITLCRFHHQQLHKGAFNIKTFNIKTLNIKTFNIKTRDQHFVFINKDNEEIPHCVHPQFSVEEADNRVQSLLADQAHIGIDQNTAETRWRGEAMDIQMAIHALYDAERDDLIGPNYAEDESGDKDSDQAPD